MGSTRTKIVFGGLGDDDAAVMAREMLRDEISLERPKHVLDKPVVVDEVPFWLESWSETEGESESTSTVETTIRSHTQGSADGTGEMDRAGVAFRDTGDWLVNPEQFSSSEGGGSSRSTHTSVTSSEAAGYSTSDTRSSQWSATKGGAQTLKPVRRSFPPPSTASMKASTLRR